MNIEGAFLWISWLMNIVFRFTKVEISYRGLIDFDEEHPGEAVKIVVITVE